VFDWNVLKPGNHYFITIKPLKRGFKDLLFCGLCDLACGGSCGGLPDIVEPKGPKPIPLPSPRDSSLEKSENDPEEFEKEI
jgi:hypothetical protein